MICSLNSSRISRIVGAGSLPPRFLAAASYASNTLDSHTALGSPCRSSSRATSRSRCMTSGRVLPPVKPVTNFNLTSRSAPEQFGSYSDSICCVILNRDSEKGEPRATFSLARLTSSNISSNRVGEPIANARSTQVDARVSDSASKVSPPVFGPHRVRHLMRSLTEC